MPIHTADISFNDQGTPVSSTFDDVYFSNDNGLEETRYVFIENNHLPKRWHHWQKSTFVIAETGFGTGLNFLVTLKLFKEFRRNNPNHPLKQLNFISFEKYPLQQQDLSAALQAWPELTEEADALENAYPLPIEGCHRLYFESAAIALDLWLGDVNQLLSQLPNNLNASIHAWFLDGFAPSKNPDMWQPNLFQHIALLTAPEGTFSTFTAAGIVKRGLQKVGFDIKKCKGFGKKREMLRGQLNNPPILEQVFVTQCSGSRYWLRRPGTSASSLPKVSVVGGGLAGVNCALSLIEKGYPVELFHADSQLASGASGNRQGGFYPNLNIDFSRTSQFYSQSFLFALQRYRSLLKNGFKFEHDFCGVLQLAFNQKQMARQQSLVEKNVWPKALIHPLSQKEAESIADVKLNCGGLFVPHGGWINPAQLVEATAQAASVNGQCKIYPNRQLQNLTRQKDGWILHWQDGAATESDIVILATGHHSMSLPLIEDIPLQAVRGQVENISADGELSKLKTVLCHKGYLTPQAHGIQALGATFIKQDINTNYRVEEEHLNLQALQQSLPDCDWVNSIQLSQSGRASIRCTTPDRLPVMGNVPDIQAQKEQYWDLYKCLPAKRYPYPKQHENLFVLTGLGSRGLCTAPLLAEALACQISGKPLPLTQDQLNALNPNRVIIKQLIRREFG